MTDSVTKYGLLFLT